MRLTIEELRRIKGEPLPEAELRRAKDHLKGSLMLSLESTGSRMNHIARQEIYFGRQFGLDEITAGIEAVSADDVARIAGDIFTGPPARERARQPQGLSAEGHGPADLTR